MLDINIGAIEAKITALNAKNDELMRLLEQINTKFEGVQGIASRDVLKIKDKYTAAKASQVNLREALASIVAYLGKVKTNYEESTNTVR